MIGVLEVGGTHVSAAVVDPATWRVVRTARADVDADAPEHVLLDSFVAAAGSVDAPPAGVWGVAMPDPFDYAAGIGNFAGVAKFAALDGVDVGAALRARLRADVVFLNDADAFVLGEWAAGVARGAGRCVGMTLGTGIGSGWLVGGVVADPGDPRGGRIHTVTVDGAPLEDVVSRRALRRAFTAAGGDPAADVREITALARDGDATARDVVARSYTVLGSVLGPRLAAFGADLFVVGGSIAASWDVLEPPFRAGAGALPPVRVVVDSDHSALVGAAVHASRAG
ncbi:glucokinase [Jatrophihabitans endophyticus]|uniref:Glucokinase n=1 Tax=Jatrophihabitans endophyticus TaxID=1206085 RepID=A0A1M5RN30_9ACTN|nr:ROK family protein [Jatrophihabitans endophyticus]SHH27747.1 glucokinase [Jatrophihabitans endophyticus]